MNELLARSEMQSMLRAAWEANAGAVTGGETPEIIWQGTEKNDPPSLEFPYARVSIRHLGGGQSSLGGVGNRRFNRYGFVFVQVYVPLGIRNHLTIALGLGKIAKDAFEGRSSPGGIWFRSCRVNELGSMDGWFQVNAVAEFTYDEVK